MNANIMHQYYWQLSFIQFSQFVRTCFYFLYTVLTIYTLYRRLGAKGSYLTLVRVADRIL